MIKNGWFSEEEVLWPGQKFSLKCEKVLFEGKSDYQDVLVFESATYGNVLVLDGVIQVTERDEHAYQEMITCLPMFTHPNPKKVLIVGGGDGGVLREVAKHEGVEEIVMCEIDRMVVEVSKKYFANSTATAYDDPRLTLLFDDAAKYLANNPAAFDVIIVDSSDPVGPAESLFTAQWFQYLERALTPRGVVCTQGECMWLHLPIIEESLAKCAPLFGAVDYAFTTIPSYPSGQIGFLLLAKAAHTYLPLPLRRPSASMARSLRYYSAEVHQAAFVLPVFAEQVVCARRKRPSGPRAVVADKEVEGSKGGACPAWPVLGTLAVAIIAANVWARR